MKYKRGEHPNSRTNLEKRNVYNSETALDAHKKSIESHYKKIAFQALLETALLKTTLSDDATQIERIANIVNALIKKGEKGDVSAIKLIVEILGQMPEQKLRVEATGNLTARTTLALEQIKKIKKQLDNL